MTSIENACFAIGRLNAGLQQYPNKTFALNCYLDALDSIREAISQMESEIDDK